MTIKCPYCKEEVPVDRGRLARHDVSAAWALKVPCIGSGESVEVARELTAAHERVRETMRRIR